MSPLDDASRGLDANKYTSSSKWFIGPEFLCHNETSWPAKRTGVITDEDPEVKHLLIVNRIKNIMECYLISQRKYLTGKN